MYFHLLLFEEAMRQKASKRANNILSFGWNAAPALVLQSTHCSSRPYGPIGHRFLTLSISSSENLCLSSCFEFCTNLADKRITMGQPVRKTKILHVI